MGCHSLNASVCLRAVGFTCSLGISAVCLPTSFTLGATVPNVSASFAGIRRSDYIQQGSGQRPLCMHRASVPSRWIDRKSWDVAITPWSRRKGLAVAVCNSIVKLYHYSNQLGTVAILAYWSRRQMQFNTFTSIKPFPFSFWHNVPIFLQFMNIGTRSQRDFGNLHAWPKGPGIEEFFLVLMRRKVVADATLSIDRMWNWKFAKFLLEIASGCITTWQTMKRLV